MNSKKDICINTSAFSITIHWNGPVVSTQLCILAGILLLRWITHNENVHTLCTVLLILDLISILIVLFMGSSIGTDSEDSDKKEDKKKTKKSDETSSEKPATKESKSSGKHSSEQKKDRTVKKRVPMPTQQGVRRPDIQSFPQPSPEPAVTQEEKPVQEKPKDTVPVSEMSEQELNDLFNF